MCDKTKTIKQRQRYNNKRTPVAISRDIQYSKKTKFIDNRHRGKNLVPKAQKPFFKKES